MHWHPQSNFLPPFCHIHPDPHPPPRRNLYRKQSVLQRWQGEWMTSIMLYMECVLSRWKDCKFYAGGAAANKSGDLGLMGFTDGSPTKRTHPNEHQGSHGESQSQCDWKKNNFSLPVTFLWPLCKGRREWLAVRWRLQETSGLPTARTSQLRWCWHRAVWAVAKANALANTVI